MYKGTRGSWGTAQGVRGAARPYFQQTRWCVFKGHLENKCTFDMGVVALHPWVCRSVGVRFSLTLLPMKNILGDLQYVYYLLSIIIHVYLFFHVVFFLSKCIPYIVLARLPACCYCRITALLSLIALYLFISVCRGGQHACVFGSFGCQFTCYSASGVRG